MTPLIDIEYLERNLDPKDARGLFTGSDPSAQDTSMLNSIISRAHSVVVANLKSIYAYPFYGAEEDIEFLKNIEFTIARYFLYGRKFNDDEMKVYYVQYNKAHKDLEKVKSGEIQLSLTRNSNSSFRVYANTNKTTEDKVFTDEYWENY